MDADGRSIAVGDVWSRRGAQDGKQDVFGHDAPTPNVTYCYGGKIFDGTGCAVDYGFVFARFVFRSVSWGFNSDCAVSLVRIAGE